MTRLNIPNSIAIIISILFIGNSVLGQGLDSNWRLYNRLQIGVEHDNNVEESLNQTAAARAIKLQFHSQARRSWPRLSVQLSYQGGYQLYWSFASENKLINEIAAQAAYKITNKIKFGLESQARLKMFLNREPRYALGDFGLFLNLRLPARLKMHIYYKSEGLDYAASDYHDYSGQSVGLQLHKRVARGLSITPLWSWRRFCFNRPAFDISYWGNWVPLLTQQQDYLIGYGCQIDWIWRGLLLNLTYHYETYKSNSYGYNFHRHRLNLVGAIKCFGVLMRFYGTLQRKSYTDDLLPFWPLELDTEKEESNFLVIDISRELFPNVILIFRTAWYENESPWPNLYYSKRLVNIGVEFRF